MHEIKEAINGIKKACNELDYPVVSGNVSLYNETNGKSIYPTPVIGGVGLIKKLKFIKGFKINDQSLIYLVGKTKGHLESSLFYSHLGITGGVPPKVNFNEEKKNGNFVKFLAQKTNILIGCHDISEGGVALAIAELCLANKKGIEVELKKKLSPEKFLFGEDQSRYLLVINEKKEFETLAKKNNITYDKIGIVTGDHLNFKDLFSISVTRLLDLNSKWFKDYLK